MKYKAIIFDLDGTLVNSLEDIKNSLDEVLLEENLPTFSIDGYRSFIGEGIRLLVKRSLPVNLQDDASVDKFLIRYKKVYERRALEYTNVYSGINELLGELNKRNIEISVISNKSDEMTKFIVKNFFPSIEFTYVIGQIGDGVKKPDPFSTNLIINDSKINREEFVFVGDSTVDIETAKNASIDSMSVHWGFRSEAQLMEYNPKYYIKNPMDILNYV